MSRDNYSQPRMKDVAVTMGDISVNIFTARQYDTFHLFDDVRNWQSIPKQVVFINPYYVLYIPVMQTLLIPQLNGIGKDIVTRRLKINTATATNPNPYDITNCIPIHRPVGKQAFLHSINYALYDYNEIIPRLTLTKINQLGLIINGVEATDPSQLIATNMFATGVHGLPIHFSSTTDEIENNYDYETTATMTTADYPIYLDISGRRTRDVKVIEKLGQTAAKSSTHHGVVYDDWLMNNFEINIAAVTPTSGIPTDLEYIYSSNGYKYGDLVKKASFNDTFGFDTPIPFTKNEIDVLIPDNYDHLTVDVSGAYYWHSIFMPDFETPGSHDSYKGITGAVTNWATMVHFPMKVQMIIRYE